MVSVHTIRFAQDPSSECVMIDPKTVRDEPDSGKDGSGPFGEKVSGEGKSVVASSSSEVECASRRRSCEE